MKKFGNKFKLTNLVLIILLKIIWTKKIFRNEFLDIIFEYEYEISEKSIIFIENYLDKKIINKK